MLLWLYSHASKSRGAFISSLGFDHKILSHLRRNVFCFVQGSVESFDQGGFTSACWTEEHDIDVLWDV